MIPLREFRITMLFAIAILLIGGQANFAEQASQPGPPGARSGTGDGRGGGDGRGRGRGDHNQTSPISRPGLIRVATVNTPEPSGLLEDLLAIFKNETGNEVTISTSREPYEEAKKCRADLVLSHYGHHGIEEFIEGGYGRLPRPVFANQAALIGPKNDPAGIRDLPDAVDAIRKIAKSGAPFVLNHSTMNHYLSQVLISAAVAPNLKIIDLPQAREQEAVRTAARMEGYVLWGAIPFYIKGRQDPELSTLDVLTYADPILQRIMVTVLISPAKCPDLNQAGALALQRYLLEPRTQARVRAFRMAGVPFQVWWPAGRHNSGQFINSLVGSP